FISNGEPMAVREIVNALLRAVGAPEVEGSVPFGVAYAAGAACEALWPLLRLRGEPPMTRFLAEQLSTTHWYDMAPATRDLGYVPRVSIAEGLSRLAAASRGAITSCRPAPPDHGPSRPRPDGLENRHAELRRPPPPIGR